MFKLICRTLHHLRSDARASPSLINPFFNQTQPFSSCPKSVLYSPNQHSFTVTYLINSCGLSPEKAISASKYLKFKASHKPDLILAFFKEHGFTKTQISNMIRRHPRILLCDTQNTLLPKLEFFKSKGVSSTDVAKLMSASPTLLTRSLENTIVPSFNFFYNLLHSVEKTIAAINRCATCSRILSFDEQTHVTLNSEILRESGVPNDNIMIMLAKQPRAFAMSSDKFQEIVKDVEKLGFNPLRMIFLVAIHAMSAMTKSTWEKKVDVYKKWGWTENEILAAFKKHPWCMTTSEDKINRVMDFVVNEMGWESSLVARRPILVSVSLEKKIVPRNAVYQSLLAKGLIKTNGITLRMLFEPPEKQFLKKFVNCYEEEAPELLKLYNEKLKLATLF